MANPDLRTLPPPVSVARPVPGPVRVGALGAQEEQAWDRFVLAQPNSSFFQLTGWKRVLEQTFPYKPRYLYAHRDGRISGVLPLFHVSNWIVGSALISVPLGVYGGICAEDEESETALRKAAQDMAVGEGVDYLELRNRNGHLYAGFHHNPLYTTFSGPLPDDPGLISKRLPKDTRYMIRRAQRNNLVLRRGIEQLGTFYTLFAQNMKRHGTPVFPRALFDHFAREFPGQTDLLIAYKEDRPVIGVFSFIYRDTMLPYYAGVSPDAPALAAANLLYFELMKDSVRLGLRQFDFGRSKTGTGAFAFKQQWNMVAEPLNYQVHLVKRTTVPNFSPVNPKFALATRVWQRLPLWVACWAGPRVVRWFP